MTHNHPAPLWRRLGWLALIWLVSVLSLGIVAGIIRWWINT